MRKSRFRFLPLFSAFRLICKCRIKTKKLYISLKISNFVIDKKNLQIYENKERDCNTLFPWHDAKVGIRETYFMDKQLQTAGQEIIQNWLQKRYSHPFRPSNINHFRLSGRALSKKRETPSYPPVRGRLVTFSSLVKSEKWRVKNRADAVGKPQAEERNLSSPKGDRRGLLFHCANRQFINKWNPLKEIRP